jgi:hypothetical protein
MKNKFDRKEEAFACIPREDQIAPGRTFGKGEGTAQMLMRLTGMSNKAALHNLERLKAEDRIHIHTWTRTANPSSVWVQGAGEDAPLPVRVERPKPEVAYVRPSEREQHERIRNGLAIDSRARTASTIEQARAKPQSWFSSLGSVDDRDGEQAA